MSEQIVKCKIIKINGSEFLVPLDDDFNSIGGIFQMMIIVKDNVFTPYIALIRESSEEDYDYDWEENLVSNGIITTTVLFPIKYNPFTGAEYKFEVSYIEDKSEEYNQLVAEAEEINKMRKSMKKTSLEFTNRQKMDKLFSEIPPIFDSIGDNEDFETGFVLENSIWKPDWWGKQFQTEEYVITQTVFIC